MKQFLIKYSFKGASEAQWQRDIAAFIESLGGDPELKGKIGYRCMKRSGGADYYHLATPVDEEAVAVLQSREFFKRYTELTRLAGGGEVEVIPLEVIAETGRTNELAPGAAG